MEKREPIPTTEPIKVKQTFKLIQLIIVLSMFKRGWVSPKKLCSWNLSIGFNVDGKPSYNLSALYCYYGLLKYYNTMTFPCENQLLKCLE